MLTTTGDLVADAARDGHGVGAFNVIALEYAEALVAGAEQAGTPVVLQISQNCVRYHGGLEPIALGTLAVARRSVIPVGVHLDHADSEDLVAEAATLGLSSVMFDASRLPYEQNVARTAAVAARCHELGVWLEAELGEVGGKDGVHAPGARTDPAQAAEYVTATGVDALAVAVGTSHAMLTRDAALDFPLIRELRGALGVPLVLHGSSGVAEEDLTGAVDAGMTKINVSTQLNKAFTGAAREVLERDRDLVDPRKYLAPAREAVAAEAARLLAVLQAQPCLPPATFRDG
ncbi:MAG: class II fructose-bisphosphate aldolase [Streptosporangiaceae bacterium]